MVILVGVGFKVVVIILRGIDGFGYYGRRESIVVRVFRIVF